jgi:hypothetical protein
MDSWLFEACRQVSLRRLWAWGLVTACGVAFCAYNSRYIQNFLKGPFQMSETDLLLVRDVETTARHFARVSGSRTVDTGIQEFTVEKQK